MLALQMVIYSYSFLVLLFLLLDSRSKKNQYSKTAHWFRIIIYATMLLLFLEAVTFAVDQIPGMLFHWINYLSNSALFLFTLLPLSLWLIYVDECVLTDKATKKKKIYVYIAFNLLVLLLVAINFFTGILFQVNANNQYMRGWAVYLIMSMNMLLFFGYLPTLYHYRKFVTGRIYELILTLGAFPIIGAVIQMLFYGVPLVWPMMALVALAAHILVEKEELRRDALTGLLSRTQMESRARYMIDRQQPFSLIMLDIDRFKSINDTYGHQEGDAVLCLIANLLAKSIKQIDSAYRYAGDEFILIIESEFEEAAARVVERLEANLFRLNKACQKPYQISFSTGIAFCDGSKRESIIDVIATADKIMYQNKKIRYGTEGEIVE